MRSYYLTTCVCTSLHGLHVACSLSILQFGTDNGSDNGYIGRDLFRVLCVGGVMVTSAVFVMLCLRCREPPRDYEAPASPRDYEAPASPRDYEEPDSPTPPPVSTELDPTNVDSEADQTPLGVVDTGESNVRGRFVGHFVRCSLHTPHTHTHTHTHTERERERDTHAHSSTVKCLCIAEFSPLCLSTCFSSLSTVLRTQIHF